MPLPDDFSSYIAELLQGSYDCVDRIALRAYFRLAQTSGGFLTWWNRLFPGMACSLTKSDGRERPLYVPFAANGER